MNAQSPILIVDDDPQSRQSLENLLFSQCWENVKSVSDGEEALEYLSRNDASLMLLDLNMPGLRGEEVLDQSLRLYPHVPVMVITGDNAISKAVECIKRGAYDFFTKPADPLVVLPAIRRALEKSARERELRSLSQAFAQTPAVAAARFPDIVTNSPKLLSLFPYVSAIAPSPEPVLILGESGTGKELFARALYDASGLSGQFVSVNLAGLDDALFSDALFGHRKGAYTGATEARSGLAEKADKGVLFLDEIGDLPLSSQVKLLRLIQEGEYYKLGSDLPSRAQLKIIAATHKNLSEAIAAGSFRQDLYYRLSAHCLRLPPLRERTQDVPLLARYFADQAARQLALSEAKLERDALDLLCGYSFPGNIRELRSVMFDCVYALGGGAITASYLKQRLPELSVSRENDPAQAPVFPDALPTLKEISALLVKEALSRSGGNQSRAAALLGITHQALSKRLKGQNEQEI